MLQTNGTFFDPPVIFLETSARLATPYFVLILNSNSDRSDSSHPDLRKGVQKAKFRRTPLSLPSFTQPDRR